MSFPASLFAILRIRSLTKSFQEKRLTSKGGGGTGKQFRGSGYHNFLGDRYQLTYTYQETDRPTNRLIELLGTAM